MKKSILLIVAGLFLVSASDSYALDRCESSFRRGLLEMKELFQRMSPACQKEVNIGESNEGRIKAVCNSQELDLALAMKTVKNGRLRPLCVDDSCGRLKDRGVCVEGKPFTYYLGQFGI